MYIREKKTKTTPALQLVSGQRDHNGKLTPIKHQEQKVMPETIINGVLLDQLKHENTTLLGPLLPLEAA